MNNKVKNIVTVCLAAVCLFGLSLYAFFKSSDDMSVSERRKLAQMPDPSVHSLLDGKFMSDFEKYSADQFPFRDSFRSLKAFSVFNLFRQKDNNDIFIAESYASQLEYPLRDNAVDTAAQRFSEIYEHFIAGKDINMYLSVIPDKTYFLADQYGYPSMDYGLLISSLRDKTDYMHYIDITDLLEISDYYKTDTHWRQEKIVDAAQRIASEMGADLSSDYTVTELDNPFYGVYYGQAALPLPPDKLYYLTNDVIDNCIVYDYEKGDYCDVYDMERAYSDDPYEIFLSGARSLMTIENPNAPTDKELVVFRDSFGSSITPLLATGYAKITLVDIRYIQSSLLGNFIDFKDGTDVLFLYSTLVLNNSITFK